MENEDRTRYLMVWSVIVDVVTPLFQQQIEHEYTRQRFTSLQDFLNQRSVVHCLFHLHRNVLCCTDQTQCIKNQNLPLNNKEWNNLYTKKSECRNKDCHCNFAANPVQLRDLDISLTSLILLNCCRMRNEAKRASIMVLRTIKNNYASHHATCRINNTEYNFLVIKMFEHIRCLDSSKEHELIRILQKRQLDESSLNRYCKNLEDIQDKLKQIHDWKIEEQNDGELFKLLKEVLHNVNLGRKEVTRIYHKLYGLGQSIFRLQHTFDLRKVFGDERTESPLGVVMMDNGTIVFLLLNKKSMFIYNKDAPVTDIPLENYPWYITAVNSSTVAVTSFGGYNIERYDIDSKQKLKSIELPGKLSGGITTINNKLVVQDESKLYIIDCQSNMAEKEITKNDYDCRLLVPCVHATGDKIFCSDLYSNNLYCYTDGMKSTTTLESSPMSITSLQDGSLYILCVDGSLQHVSSDGKHYKTVTNMGQKLVGHRIAISYNQKQRKLVTMDVDRTVEVFDGNLD